MCHTGDTETEKSSGCLHHTSDSTPLPRYCSVTFSVRKHSDLLQMVLFLDAWLAAKVSSSFKADLSHLPTGVL